MFSFINSFDIIEGGRITLKIAGRYAGDGVRLPVYLYDICAENTIVGQVSIHIGHNAVSSYSGNIGYEIYPRFRGKRYSLEAARLVLPVAAAHGMDRLLITCLESNAASRRIAELLGAGLVGVELDRNQKALCIYRLMLTLDTM